MRQSKIDWTDYSWNPITGCENNCPYCYARQIANRFSGDNRLNMTSPHCKGDKENGLLELDTPFRVNGNYLAYPFGFIPTLHRYMLDRPKDKKSGANIFVCAMADMFGNWVPDEWIKLVFEKCLKYGQHNYLFLTKNPDRYERLLQSGDLPQLDNMWYGTTITNNGQSYFNHKDFHTFLSIEPILEAIQLPTDNLPDWIIIGRETGRRTCKVSPEKTWIMSISEICQQCDVPIFMKDNLMDLVDSEFLQQRPRKIIDKDASRIIERRLIGNCFLCGKDMPKKQMFSLTARKANNGKAENFGHLCYDCYDKIKLAIDKNKLIEVHEDADR